MTGKLKPSTRLTSKKSLPPSPFKVNSTSVAGAAPPALHCKLPQSPVPQDVPASLQNALAQILPDQVGVAVRALEACDASANPDDEMVPPPPPVVVAGQIV